eukprot:798225-Ditylum_brightwellii.AAC.1
MNKELYIESKDDCCRPVLQAEYGNSWLRLYLEKNIFDTWMAKIEPQTNADAISSFQVAFREQVSKSMFSPVDSIHGNTILSNELFSGSYLVRNLKP